MRVPIPEERKKLIDVFYPYLCNNSKEGEKPALKDDAPESAKRALDEYMKLVANEK